MGVKGCQGCPSTREEQLPALENSPDITELFWHGFLQYHIWSSTSKEAIFRETWSIPSFPHVSKCKENKIYVILERGQPPSGMCVPCVPRLIVSWEAWSEEDSCWARGRKKGHVAFSPVLVCKHFSATLSVGVASISQMVNTAAKQGYAYTRPPSSGRHGVSQSQLWHFPTLLDPWTS